ncbi:MAG: efflux RND transporter periplasmic adaptor subunit [Betaproteobacteria bacterium]|nr:efflux RND transporter periplasmic adaptor subunit [Betaproteobacteria bacterium]
MNKAVIAVMAVLVVLVAAGAGYWFGSAREFSPAGSRSAPGRSPEPAAIANAAAGASKGQALVPVEITRVGTASLPQTITAVGTLRSDESVTLRPEVAGRITAILFQEGQRVAKGATLVRLDPAISTAELQQARANLTLARTKYERAVDLAGRTFISGQAKDEAKHSLDIAEAAVALAEAKLAKMELKAPFAGIIGLRVVSIGDYVKEGTDLVNLEAIDPLKVDFRIPETFLTQVQVGQPIKVALDALPGESYDGRVIALNPLVDAAGRAIVIRAQVRNQNTALRPGMFARVTLITRAEKDALVLPEEAFVPQGTEQYVFRVLEGRAARVKVETGQRRDGKVEIVSGVGRGDVVVTAGQSRLRDGAQVRIADAQAGKVAPDLSKPSPSASSRRSEDRETAK